MSLWVDSQAAFRQSSDSSSCPPGPEWCVFSFRFTVLYLSTFWASSWLQSSDRKRRMLLVLSQPVFIYQLSKAIMQAASYYEWWPLIWLELGQGTRSKPIFVMLKVIFLHMRKERNLRILKYFLYIMTRWLKIWICWRAPRRGCHPSQLLHSLGWAHFHWGPWRCSKSTL